MWIAAYANAGWHEDDAVTAALIRLTPPLRAGVVDLLFDEELMMDWCWETSTYLAAQHEAGNSDPGVLAYLTAKALDARDALVALFDDDMRRAMSETLWADYSATHDATVILCAGQSYGDAPECFDAVQLLIEIGLFRAGQLVPCPA